MDEKGYLRDWTEWTPDLAQIMAGADGIELDEDHWRVIEILRDYYAGLEEKVEVKLHGAATGDVK